ncbi:hypothetical protein QBC46DRAFT_374176 [Diplogelasinospora grovesii]|uniref:Ubiquitin carboxyl-terminal hydrolase 19 n=1 Tax=Diplogelasinospora grovesii TaxID=303347 RepID=A0AAN6NGI7_9PEZI|nr:hypothetical protein QBC46DRAFT_374176 [Diplogelasinospora grovesii]
MLGPVHVPPPNEVFGDLDEHDEQSQNLLGSLQLGTEDEPIRRGAASRANSVRFDESALQGANWGGHGSRHSGDYGSLARPSSGMGGHQMMERSLSHKSDGRHSSAGHSVHSVHSGVSGRASSLGLDTNFLIGSGGDDDDSPLDIPEPPPGFYFLGSPPSIVRCWLTTEFTSDTLLYAVVCTGSQRSTMDYSLVRDLNLLDDVHRDVDGVHRITLPVFLAEARVTQSNSRTPSPAPQLPSITSTFEVTGMDQKDASSDAKKSIRVFIGSHTLRMHSADILLSQNSMTLYGDGRDKLSVPFVRPEDDAVYKYLTVTNMVPEKPKLNAAAPEFVSSDKVRAVSAQGPEIRSPENAPQRPLLSPRSESDQPLSNSTLANGTRSESGGESEKQVSKPTANNNTVTATTQPEPSEKESSSSTTTAAADAGRRDTSAAIRTPWRQTAAAVSSGIGSSSEGLRDSTLLSGYQPASRPRSMKVLRPNRSGSSSTTSNSARTGAAYEPAPGPPRSSGEFRRTINNYNNKVGGGQSEGGGSSTSGGSSSNAGVGVMGRWGESSLSSVGASKRAFSTSSSGDRILSSSTNNSIGNFGSSGSENKPPPPLVNSHHHHETISSKLSSSSSLSGTKSPNNPLGSASAFSWINPAAVAKPKTTTAAAAATAE